MKKTHLSIGKYVMLSFLALGLTLSSCKKEEEKIEEEEVIANELPSSFTKKALIEEYTGEWCVWCPAGAEIIAAMKVNNPNKYVAIGVHYNDPLEIPQFDVLRGMFSISGFPSATVVRKEFGGDYAISRGIWESSANSDLAIAATAGIKIETTMDGSVTVNYGANSDMSDLKLTVYVIEDNVREVGDQIGAATGYIHQDVLREVLSGSTGDDVTIAAGEIQTASFTANLSGLDAGNTKIAAFLHKHDVASNDFQVINVQEVHLGSTSQW